MVRNISQLFLKAEKNQNCVLREISMTSNSIGKRVKIGVVTWILPVAYSCAQLILASKRPLDLPFLAIEWLM